METNFRIELQYLKSQSIVREEILNHKLIYDLQVSAAKRKTYLKVYKPEIDIEGYDIIVEDTNDFSRKIQLKSKISNKTRWEIHRTILLPGMHNSLDYGFNETICPTNPGAIILMDLSNSESIENITYYYTDINILSLYALGYLKTDKKTIELASKKINELKTNKKFIYVSQSLFIKIKNADALINLCGFSSKLDFVNSTWKLNQIHNRFGKFIDNFQPYNINEEYLLKLEQEKEAGIKHHSKVILKLLEDII